MLADVPDGLVELATLAALVPPLADVGLHVFLQQVASEELFLAKGTLEGLLTYESRERKNTIGCLFSG